MKYPLITRTATILATITLLSGMAVGETAKPLLPPQTDGGMPLMEALAKRMDLEEHQRVILTQPVGYPAGHPNADAPATETPETAALRDGTYQAAARGYVGDISVEVTVEQGRLTAVNVLQHRENRPGRALQDLPARMIAAQTPDAVDAVTGATVTSEALKNAVREALKKAR